MKSKTSCFNKTIFKKNITHYWPIWLIILAWNLFVMPFMIYNSSLSYRMMDYATEQELVQIRANDILSIVFVYANPVVLFIFSIVAVMAVFSYLYNMRSANTIHALPVTRRTLFVTNYISGLLFLLIPEIIGFLTGILVSALCGYTSMNHLLTGLLFATGISFVCYSFTVFIAMFTGQLLAVPIFTVILNFLFVGCKSLIAVVMSLVSYGLPLSISEGKMDVLSPLYYIVTHMDLMNEYSSEVTVLSGISGGKIVAGYVIVAIFFVIAAYLIYRIRHMETAGNLISIFWICPVFRWGAAFCGGISLSVLLSSVMSFQSVNGAYLLLLVSAILFGICSFFGAQMFLEKGFRVFKKKRIIECTVFSAVLACLLISIKCDLFGQERKIPDASNVESVYLNAYNTLGGSDEKLIAQMQDIHRQIIDSKEEFQEYEVSGENAYYINIIYYLKNGSMLRRQYTIPTSKEMLEDHSSVIYQIAELNAQPENYARELFGDSYDTVEPRSAQFSLFEDDEWYQHELSAEEAEKIYRAVLADIKEGNFRDCIHSRYNYNMYNGSTYSNNLSIEYFSKEENTPMKYNTKPQYYDNSMTRFANIEFDAKCKNTIEALLELGVIESQEDLITLEEIETLNEEQTKQHPADSF